MLRRVFLFDPEVCVCRVNCVCIASFVLKLLRTTPTAPLGSMFVHINLCCCRTNNGYEILDCFNMTCFCADKEWSRFRCKDPRHLIIFKDSKDCNGK